MRSIQPKHLFNGSTALLVVAYFALALTGVSGSPCPLPAPPSPAEAAKQAALTMYEAINTGRQDKYLDSVLEKKHTDIQPMGVLGAVSGSLALGKFGVGMDWDKLTERTYYRLVVTPLSPQTSTHVLVEARGRQRHGTVDRDVDFCQLWDVSLVGDRWLVDVDSDESRARLAAQVSKHIEKYPVLAQLSHQFGIHIDLDGFLMQYGIGDEELYNMCE